MKKLLLPLLAILCIFYLSCKKGNDGPGEIYGKWKLTETLMDPGDGSGKYQKVKGKDQYLILEKSGKIEGDVLAEFSTFKILDSVRIEIKAKSNNQALTYYYKVSAKSLTLNPPCIEGCGLRFERN
ncbi:hypothetical protein DU508_21435 [Pedobacter chinensis]|uniref:Lipocalin-like domain-containing protein n=1 Tax=Pedobacter chinensis TaxID=2282421 RepID=A0A369PPK2_9SPHI|nr:hypothetical protein [Pedobacter chinensis]RDC54531.1 hypothetical protein DU508_21435 [Pedobacter chinensis]